MAERKSRLKLKAKKTNSDANRHITDSKAKSESSINFKPVTPIDCPSVSMLTKDKQNIDVINIIDDDDDDNDVSVISRPPADIQKPKLDSKLLDLQQKLSKFTLPFCDVWKLDDLLPFSVKAKTISTSKCHTGTEELLPLPRFSKEYLAAKRPSSTLECQEQLHYHLDIPVQDNLDSTNKRKISKESQDDSKRKRLSVDGFELPDVENEKVCGKSTTSGPPTQIDTTKLCPICSATFPPSVNQMDIDSHIASCLSLADDDVDW